MCFVSGSRVLVQNPKSVMEASSHGPKTAGPVERPPAPPAASHSRRRTRSMSANESLAGERDGSALVAPTLTDHQGDVACDDPHSKSPQPIPRCARVPDPRAHLDDTDAQPADPLPSTAACQVRVISTTSTVKTSSAEAAAPSYASQETERARTTRQGGKALTGGEADRVARVRRKSSDDASDGQGSGQPICKVAGASQRQQQ